MAVLFINSSGRLSRVGGRSRHANQLGLAENELFTVDSIRIGNNGGGGLVSAKLSPGLHGRLKQVGLLEMHPEEVVRV